MRISLLLGLLLPLAACTFPEDSGDGPYTCSNRDQKRFVRDATEYWYLWNDLLPDKIRVRDYDDPADLLASLTAVQPLDSYSYIGSAAADAAFFGAGQYLGFGFSWRRDAADDVRLTIVFANSPAAQAGFARGQRLVALDGRSIAEIESAEGLDAVLDQSTLDFTLQETDGVTEFTVTVTQDVVTIEPVPQWRLIPTASGPPVGYLELVTFVATAEPELEAAFADFRANGVTDVILDLRYNGGGLVSTAELSANLLGGDVADGLVFTRTLFNADRSAEFDREELFVRLASSLSLSRLVVIATADTASASEILTNGLEPHVEVTIVGDRTFGKPVGQLGFEFCGNVLRLTGFQTVNADGFGDYFDGLPADCAAPDDLALPVGDPADPNMLAALGYLETGACPPVPAALQRGATAASPAAVRERDAAPWRQLVGAY